MFATTGLVAFVGVSDLQRADEFYGIKLGMEKLFGTPFSSVYASGSTQLWVTLPEKVHPQPYTVAGWNVADIEEAVSELEAAGIETIKYDGFGQDERGIWDTPSGARLVWFADPDGNLLSASQLA